MAGYSQMESCCGIGEMFSLEPEPIRNLMDMYAEMGESWDHAAEKPRKMVIFTDNNIRKCGLKLAAYIEKNKLGPLTFSGWVKNTNQGHGTKVGLWTWKPYWTKVNKLVRAEEKREKEKEKKRMAEYEARQGKHRWW